MRENAHGAMRRHQWQEPTIRVGPIAVDRTPRWVPRLELFASVGCSVLASLTLLAGAYIYIADKLAGHL